MSNSASMGTVPNLSRPNWERLFVSSGGSWNVSHIGRYGVLSVEHKQVQRSFSDLVKLPALCS